MKISQRIFLFLNGLFLIGLLVHSISRDIRLDNEFPTDLRNRVVGARLQKDGKLPYHHHWQVSDGLRYYNPDESYWLTADGKRFDEKTDSAPINQITASPFFHELLYPICDLPQRTISRIWLTAEYIFLAGMIAMIMSLTSDKRKKWILLNAGILFTCTEAWILLVASGQHYFFLAFLISFIIWVLLKNKKQALIWGGLGAAVLILCRPMALVFMVPFLAYFKNYRVFLGSAFSALFLYALFVVVNPGERAVYRDYWEAMKSHVRLHELSNPVQPPAHEQEPHHFQLVEGFDLSTADQLAALQPVAVNNENGNVFVLYFKIFRTKISPVLLNTGLLITIAALTFLFYTKNRAAVPDILKIVLLGFIIYLITEIFSPIYRRPYNTVQWFPLLMAGSLLIKNWKEPAALLMIAGLFLNIGHLSWLPMRHSLGECCWMFGLLILINSRSLAVR